jgi:hypothetical protein
MLELFESRGLTDNKRRLELCDALGTAAERVAKAEEGRVEALVCALEGNGRGDQVAAEQQLRKARQELSEVEAEVRRFMAGPAR